jgi:hypothetical protein
LEVRPNGEIVPSERLRRELDAVLAGVGEREGPVEAVARVAARLVLQQALEDEVTEFRAASAISAPMDQSRA